MLINKVPSEITNITLNAATYNGVSFSPTLINFFFGNNGTGKSTIGKEIKKDNGVQWRTGRTASNYTIYVYNQDFINANIQNYNSMPGVFTMNEQNIEIQNKVAEMTAEKEKLDIEYSKMATDKGKKEEALDTLFTTFQNSCWDKTKTIREKFDKTQEGKKRKQQFADAVLNVKNPQEHDIKTLETLYEIAYGADAKKYEEFSVVEGTSVLDSLNGSDILGKSIVSSSETPFAAFVKAIKSTDWVRSGHEQFHTTPDGKCPYCQQPLPDDFEEQITACFDAQYQEDISTLERFYNDYKEKANELFLLLQTIPHEIYPRLDTVTYTDKLAVLKSKIQANVQKIVEKKAEPSCTVSLERIEPILKELVDLVLSFNKAISENNAVLAAKPQKQSECSTDVWELIAFTLKSEIASYRTSKTTLEKEVSELKNQMKINRDSYRNLGIEMASLNRQIVNTKATIDSINRMLLDSGFQGFSIREKEGMQNVYEVIRDKDETVAESLSEGERNFIAFLYFYHLVRGSETADGGLTDKIVIIDDPVSSMDSCTLFIVSALIREMIEICRNNAEGVGSSIEGNFIKQIFVLTHNAYFHREVTYSYVSRYPYVNFYCIRKADNLSTITLCERPKDSARTQMENYNPVQNSYAALWTEYRCLNASIPLLNVIRRILEYYFLQLCGYDSSDLRQRILVANKEKFVTVDENGKEDYTKFHIASAMLFYISANSIGMNDGMNYIDDCTNEQQCRETFEMIFTLMNQEQHYKMMMGINQ